MTITLSESRDLPADQVIGIYSAHHWGAAKKPTQLMNALKNSHSLVSAWDGPRLVGLGNSLSDGYLMVYYPHLLVHPDYQGKGVGKMIFERMQDKYRHLHMQMLTADGNAIEFYRKAGFKRAGTMEPMWIYDGAEH